MKLRSYISSSLQSLANYISKPERLKLRLKGVPISTYRSLDQKWLRELKIATVIDIGANYGQFAQAARIVFPGAKIYSFEPLPDCFGHLMNRMGKDANFEGFNFGLGVSDEILTFERNAFSASSSFLKMTETHKNAFPFTRECQPIKVIVKPLDTVATQLQISEPLLIKIDVQGYENFVLKGGRLTVSRARLLIVETSFEPLYEGEALFHEIYSTLISWGFAYRGSINQMNHPESEKILQEDSIFIRE